MWLLNDDCLCEVFRRMALGEQINMARVCARFMHIIVDYILRKEFNTLFTEDPRLAALNLEDFTCLFRLLAAKTKSLSIADTSPNRFSSFLVHYSHRPELQFYFSLDLTNIVEFTCMDSRFNDGYMRSLALKCKQLRVLHVHSDYTTGAHITDMHASLEELQLTHCGEDHLEEILGSASRLKTLHIGNVELTTSGYSALVVKLPKTLQTLVIRDAMGLGLAVAERHNLTSLKIVDTFANCFNYDPETTASKRQTNFQRFKRCLTSLEIKYYRYSGKVDAALLEFLTSMLTSPNRDDDDDDDFDSTIDGLEDAPLKLFDLVEQCKNLNFVSLPLQIIDSQKILELLTDLLKHKRSLKLVLGYLDKEDMQKVYLEMRLQTNEIFKSQTLLTVDYVLFKVEETGYVKYTFVP